MAPKRPSTSVVTPPRIARISAVLLTTLPIRFIRRAGNISCSCNVYATHGHR
jgi:hypothetical protein